MSQTEQKIFYRKLKTLAIPMTIQQLMTALVSVSDAVMLGILSQDALSAVSLAGQVQFVYSLFLFAAMQGVSIFAAQYWSNGNHAAVEKILGIGLKMSVLLSLPFTIGAIFLPLPFMHIFASDSALIDLGADYLRVVGITYFLQSISQIYLVIMKNSGLASQCAAISGTSVVANIVLNAVFIFVFHMGVTGAALATLISKGIELIWTLPVMVREGHIKIRISYVIRNDKMLAADFWKYTLPILGDEVAWGIGFTMYTVIMGHLGSDAAAANSIANIIKNLAICFCTGIAGASGIMIGGQLGLGNLKKAKVYGSRFVKLSIWSGIASGIIILCVIPFVKHFSTLTSTAQGYLKIMLVVCSYYIVGKSVNTTVFSGIFSSGGDSKFGLICNTITMWVIVVPIGLISAFVLKLPVTLVYILINIDEIIKLPAVYRNYKKYRWVKNLTKSERSCSTV